MIWMQFDLRSKMVYVNRYVWNYEVLSSIHSECSEFLPVKVDVLMETVVSKVYL